MTDSTRKFAGWLWVGLFYVLVFVAGIAVFVGGAILLFRITSIEVPGRLHDDANARTSEYYGYTDPGS